MWCTMQMQWTYCCDTFQLVRVGCKIGGSTLRHQIKSRSAMFLLVCLGLRPHWYIHRKWHFTAFQLDLLYPDCILYNALISALRKSTSCPITAPGSGFQRYFILPWRRLCLCYSGVPKYAAVRITSRVYFKIRKDHYIGKLAQCGLQLSQNMQAYSPQQIAPDWNHRSSAFFFIFSPMHRSSGFALVPWQRKGSSSRAPRFESMCLGVEVRNPEMKSSHNFVRFVGPRSLPVSWGSFSVCDLSWVYVENGGTSCLWLPTPEWYSEPRLKSIDGTLVGELVVNGSCRTDALHSEQSETWWKLCCQDDMLLTIEIHWLA